MTIQVGDTLPTVGLTTMTAEGPKPVSYMAIKRKIYGHICLGMKLNWTL